MDSDPAQYFANLLRTLRDGANLTQGALAKKSGVSERGISDIECGKSVPRRSTVALLADALELSTEQREMFFAARLAAARAAHSTRASGSAKRTPSAAPLPQSVALAPASRLHGRRRECAQIDALLAGEGVSTVAFLGEPGIGKSRMLEYGAERARQAGMVTLRGDCEQSDARRPYSPVAQALEDYLRDRSKAERRRLLKGCEEVAPLLPPDLRAAAPRSPDWQASLDRERWLLFDAAARLFLRIAEPAGALLAFDDLQWAGPDGLALIARLVQEAAKSAQPRRLHLLLGLRDSPNDLTGALESHLLTLSSANQLTQMQLHPLSEECARAVLYEALGEQADARVIDEIVKRANGAPLYLMGFVGAAREAAESGKTQTPLSIPRTIAGMIRRRINALTPRAIEILRLAAVWGRQIPIAPLIGASGTDRPGVIAALEEAYAARLLQEERGVCVFPHDLYRDVILADLSLPRKEQLHHQIAMALRSTDFSGQAEPLAFHFAHSADDASALHYLEQAADAALAIHAYQSAEANFRDALTRAARSDPHATARLRTKLGDLYIRRGQYPLALETLSSAFASYKRSGDQEGMGYVVARMGWAQAFSGASPQGLRRLAPWVTGPTLRALTPQTQSAIFSARAVLLFTLNRYSAQLENATHAVALALESRATDAQAKAFRLRGMALLLLGRLSEAELTLRDSLAYAEQVGDLRTYVTALNDLADLYHIRGETRAFQTLIEQASANTERLGDLSLSVITTTTQGDLAYMLGDWDTARERYQAAQSQIGDQRGAWVASYPLLAMGRLNLVSGEEEKAMAQLTEAFALAKRGPDLQALRYIQPVFAERDLLRYAPDQALERLLPLLGSNYFNTRVSIEKDALALLPYLAWAQGLLGAQDDAIRTLDRCEAQAQATGADFVLVDAYLARALLRLLRKRADDFAAVDNILRAALRLARKMSHPYARAKALYLYGLLDIARNRYQSARQRLKAAQAICRKLHERLYRANIAKALRRLELGGHAAPHFAVQSSPRKPTPPFNFV